MCGVARPERDFGLILAARASGKIGERRAPGPAQERRSARVWFGGIDELPSSAWTFPSGLMCVLGRERRPAVQPSQQEFALARVARKSFRRAYLAVRP